MFRAFVEKLRQSQWLASATGLFLIYFVLGSAPALTVADVTIDPSWMAFLSLAAVKPWTFGQDLVFSYGPLGHLLAGSYIGEHFHLLQLSRFGYAAALALMLALVARSLPFWPRCWLSLGYLLVAPADWMLLGPALFGLWLLREDRPFGWWLGLAAFCGALALFKFNYFVYYGCLFAALAVVAFGCGRRLRAVGIGLALVVAILLWWLAGGGAVGQFWPWLKETFKFTLSYNQILAWPSPIGVWLFSLCWLLLVLAVGLAVARVSSEQAGYSYTACLAAAFFAAALSWKHGFTRGYPANYAGFFATSCLLPLFFHLPARRCSEGSAPLVRWSRCWREWHARLLTPRVATTLGCLFAASVFQILLVLIGPRLVFKERFATLPQLTRYVLQNRNHHSGYERQLEAQRARWSLGSLTQAVGRASVDLLGEDQSLVILNQLNSRPRPYFQSYCALTPEAQRRNAAFYHGATAPEFVLLLLNPMENRLPTMEDGLCLRELLAHYDYVDTAVLREFTYAWLPRADAEAPLFRRGLGVIAEHPERLAAGSLEWGARVPIPPARPGSVVWLRLETGVNALGKLGYVLCRPPELKLTCFERESFLGEFLVLPIAAESGFILGPWVQTSRDLAQFAKRPGDARYPDAFAVTAKFPRFFKTSARYELWEYRQRSQAGL